MPDMARIAYEAYGASTGGKNFLGDPMPEFDDLPAEIRQAWDAATQAVLRAALPEAENADDEDRIRDAMAEAQDHPGRMVTR